MNDQAAPPNANYLLRHWRGELTLPVSYWLNGSLILTGATLFSSAILAAMGNASLQSIAIASILQHVFALSLWVWSSVGIWRSAGKHATRGGSRGWAIAARIVVVLGTIATVSRLFGSVVPQLHELGLIASGQDPLGVIQVSASPDGKAIILQGTLGEGSAAVAIKAMDAAPGAKILVLNSNGGRLREARFLMEAVGERHLNTYVENRCVSACTYIFLAGQDRAATPNAQIGFHQPSFAGGDPQSQKFATDAMTAVYRKAGLPEDFVRHIARTPAESMWYPSRDEMIAANVLTRVSLGGEGGYALAGLKTRAELLLTLKEMPMLQAYDRRFPGILNEMADKAWAVKTAGGTDKDIQNATRAVASQTIPRLLQSADDTILLDFGKLMLDELSAARDVSDEACARLLNGKLDITATLPADVIAQEKSFLMKALSAPPGTQAGRPVSAEARQVLAGAASRLTPEQLEVMSNIEAHKDQATAYCDAVQSLNRSVMSLPPAQRALALQAMYQDTTQR